MGPWSPHGEPRDTVSVSQGLREALPATKVTFAEGVTISRRPTSGMEQARLGAQTLGAEALREAMFQVALKAAREAEAVVMVLGEAQDMSGEDESRAHLDLPGEQERLLEAVCALGKPVALVLMTGRPLTIEWVADHVPAILNIWYPGTEGGHGVARLLLGDVNPGGHLPVTWPRDSAQEPLFYNSKLPHNPSNTEHRYWAWAWAWA